MGVEEGVTWRDLGRWMRGEKEKCEKETCGRVAEMGEFVAGGKDEAEDGGDKDRVGKAFRGLENR